MREKLERCPFCGGEVSFWTRPARGMGEYQALIIECKDCPANMEEWVYKHDKNFAENFEKEKAEMYEAWNRRAERTAKVEEVEKPNVYKCSECGQYFHRTAWGSLVEYCSRCGCRLEWE